MRSAREHSHKSALGSASSSLEPRYRSDCFLLDAIPLDIATARQNASPARTEATTEIAQKSIAVLPLLNESGDPKDEYFSDGLSEELIAALAQIRDLKVIGRSSSFRFKDRKEEPKTIGEKLGVATLLEGTVRKQGDRVRIVAELINAADGIELWTRTFDRELKDIFAVQQEIAAAVAESLKVTLLGSEDKTPLKCCDEQCGSAQRLSSGPFLFSAAKSR